MRRTAGYAWADCKINSQGTKEIKIHNSGQITGKQEQVGKTCI